MIKTHTLICFKMAFLFFCSLPAFSAIKQVEFDWISASVRWESRVNYLPCKEPFNIRIINAPTGTSKVIVRIFNSSGTAYNNIVSAAQLGRDFELSITNAGSDIIAYIPQELLFRRYYYVEVVLETTATTSKSFTGAAPPAAPTSTVVVSNPRPSVDVTTTTETLTTTTSPPSASPSPVTTTTVTTIVRTTETRRAEKAYAIPLRSEISSLQFLSSIADVAFTQSGFKDMDHNVALLTGIKIKWKPVSTNPDIGRFGLYPKRSRWSLVIGTVLSEVSYKTTEVKALPVGLKLVGGIDWEFSQNLGITLGGVVGNQDIQSKLTSKSPVVVGMVLGISFSTEIFQKWNQTFPASARFPTGSDQQL